jgi:hypothetical protein
MSLGRWSVTPWSNIVLALGLLVGWFGTPEVQAESTSMTGDPISIERVSVKGQLIGGKWVETVILKNTGTDDATGVIVTSWPYNDKDLVNPDDPKGPRKDSATQAGPGAQFSQSKTVDIPAGKQRVITFTYEGGDAKKWKNWYVDAYQGAPKVTNRVFGGLGGYAFLPVAPGPGGSFAVDIQRPYPAALLASDIFGPATFRTQITNLSLPSGWSLANFSPFVSTLAADQTAPFSVLMQAAFTTAPTISPGEVAFVDFDAVLQGTDQRWEGELGIEVTPEPSTFTLLSIGALGLLGYSWRQHQLKTAAYH